MKKRIVIISVSFLILILALMSIPVSRSMIIMKIYSEYNKKESLLNEKNIEIHIPGGGDWYPFVMTFSADHGFSTWMGEELRLTILYNIPKFSWKQGASKIYDPESEYYNSFYGAYLVERENGEPYGYDENGTCILTEIAEVPKYDFWKLVLEDIGMSREVRCFDWSVKEVQENVMYVGENGWTRITAELIVNGMYHNPDEYSMSYLQYGKPRIQRSVDEYEPVQMEGLIYGKYFPEENVSIFFYCIAQNEEIVRQVDETLLSQSFLEIVDFSK